MTDGSPRPDEENGDELAPPFVPGTPTSPAKQTTGEQGLAERATEPSQAEPPPTEPPTKQDEPAAEEPAETGAPEADEADPFPFETGWDEAADVVAEEAEEGEEAEVEATPSPAPGAGETPLDALEAAPAEEPVAPSAPTHDDFPVDSFDIEGEGEGEGDVPTPAESGPDHAAAELADRLEDMARRLRDEGPAAAEAEMSSGDRFTALLAGLLAGYLAARQ